MSNLPQQDTIVQYQADGSTLIYAYDFKIPLPQDIGVYVTPPNSAANPSADKLILNVDYTVQGTGDTNGGTVTFLSAPASGAIVTLSRDMEFSLDTQFADAKTLNGENLDDAFERVELQMQQLWSYQNDRTLSYAINTFKPDLPTDVLVPPLGDGEIWMGQNNEVIAVFLEQNPDVSTLRSELAQNANAGASGSTLVGYFDSNATNPLNAPTNVQLFLDNLPTYIQTVLEEILPPPDIVWEVGDIRTSMNSNVLSGWVPWYDGFTIGDPSSGADYANANSQDLFEFLWNNFNNDICPVSTGRGATAADDFDANKTLTLPNTNGCALINTVGGVYTPGQKIGAVSVSLSGSNNGYHAHSFGYSTPQSAVSVTNDADDTAVWRNQLSTTGGATAADGSGTPFSILQPSMPCYYYLKL